jgi:hypothetical protein
MDGTTIIALSTHADRIQDDPTEDIMEDYIQNFRYILKKSKKNLQEPYKFPYICTEQQNQKDDYY